LPDVIADAGTNFRTDSGTDFDTDACTDARAYART
jgi:hypothetical protein